MTFIYESNENIDNTENNIDEDEKIFCYVPTLVPPFRGIYMCI